MTDNTHKKLQEIKQSFRLLMNGETARSMRDKGVCYHLNWGINIVDLRRMASEQQPDYELAVELFKENIRECKILATMLMPKERMEQDLAELWMEQTEQQEIAEQAVINIYQYLPFAPALAFPWIASERQIEQLSGYLLLGRIFMNGQEPNERSTEELLDQARSVINDAPLPLRHAAANCLMRLSELGEEYKKRVGSLLNW